MKAIRLHELEGPDELVYEDVPEPEPAGTVSRRYAGRFAEDTRLRRLG
jgi:NADPH:quinone reductase-like Zn-dependent oxidoreductase